MFFFLLMFGLTIAACHLYYTRADEISRLTTGLISLLGLFLSLIFAPWLIKIAAVIAIAMFLPSDHRSVL